MLELNLSFKEQAVTVLFSDEELFKQAQDHFKFFLSNNNSSQPAIFTVNTQNGESSLKKPSGDEQTLENASIISCLQRNVSAHWIALTPEYLWLHAGGVAHKGEAVIFVGPGGSGKSTLVMECLSKGWQYLCDDALAIDTVTLAVHPLPFPPARRTTYQSWMTRSDFLFQKKQRGDLHAIDAAIETSRVSELIFIQYDSKTIESSVWEPLSTFTTASALLSQSFSTKEHHQSVIAKTFTIAQKIPRLARVRYSSSVDVIKALSQRHLNGVPSGVCNTSSTE